MSRRRSPPARGGGDEWAARAPPPSPPDLPPARLGPRAVAAGRWRGPEAPSPRMALQVGHQGLVVTVQGGLEGIRVARAERVQDRRVESEPLLGPPRGEPSRRIVGADPGLQLDRDDRGV